MVVNNPNNWHWVDKNCIDWTRNYFNEKLLQLTVEDGKQLVGIKSISSVEGDVEVCQRKGKVISLFDLKLTLEIGGVAGESESPFKGSIVIPELAYDTTEDELQFDVSIYNEDKENEGMRSVVKSKLIPQLRQALGRFGKDLISTHSEDIQLSEDKVNSAFTKENQQKSGSTAAPAKTTPAPTKAAPAVVKTAPTPAKATSTESSNSSIPKYNTATLHLEPTFNTTAEQLYITLLDPARLAAWTRSPPQIDAFPPAEGSSFKLFGGSISGKLTKLVTNERITQLWRLDDWKSGHYAQLDIQLVQGAGETKMVVKWSGIPIGEEDRVRGNFENYYIRSIKITFGFGAVL